MRRPPPRRAGRSARSRRGPRGSGAAARRRGSRRPATPPCGPPPSTGPRHASTSVSPGERSHGAEGRVQPAAAGGRRRPRPRASPPRRRRAARLQVTKDLPTPGAGPDDGDHLRRRVEERELEAGAERADALDRQVLRRHAPRGRRPPPRFPWRSLSGTLAWTAIPVHALDLLGILDPVVERPPAERGGDTGGEAEHEREGEDRREARRDRPGGRGGRVEHANVGERPRLHDLQLLRLVEEGEVELVRHLHVAQQPRRLQLRLGQLPEPRLDAPPLSREPLEPGARRRRARGARR